MGIKKTILINSTLTLLFTCASNNLFAAGFSIAEQSVKGLGSAFSGGSASADDAATVWYNPAGMSRFNGTHISSGLHLILPSTEYTDRGSIVNPALTGGAAVPITGTSGVREKEALVPSFYIIHTLTPKINLGFGMNAPFGLVTDHDSDWIGRYHALRSDVATVNFNPAISYKVSNQFSVGAGINIQYVDVKLSRTINTSAACLASAPLATCASLGLTNPASAATDSQVRLEAHDWSYGFNFGFLYEPSPDTRLGFHYRSSIKHRVAGRAEFFFPSAPVALFGAGAGLVNQGIKSAVDLPESVSISGFHQLNPKWSIQTDITWMKWNRFKELRIRFDSGLPDDSVTPEEWQNTIRFAIGTNYIYNSKLTLRGGLAYDQTPIADASLRTPRIADENRVWLSLGATYAVTSQLTMDVGYAHLFVTDPEIDYVTGFPATPHAEDSTLLNGGYHSSVDIISAQVNFAF